MNDQAEPTHIPVLVVVSFAIPTDGDWAQQVPEILKKIDPPNLPHFNGEVRVVAGPEDVAYIIDRLENE